LTASAPFYGAPLPRELSETLDGACPIVASFGSRDPIGIGAPKKLQQVLDQKGITNDVKATRAPATALPTSFPRNH
jgi:carboxymethylenebutenolidase